VVVATLGLDGLNDNSGNGVVPFLDETLSLLQATLLLLGVLFGEFLKRILQRGERSLRPVKGRDIKLVDGLAASGRQTAEETTVETSLERHDRQLGRTGGLVDHAGLDFLLGELLLGATTLLLTVVHESGLVSSLVGIGTGHGSEHLVQALRSDLEDTSLEDVGPIGGGKVSESWSVDQRGGHLRGFGHLEKVGVVVSDRDRGDLGVAVVC
jgi:hypothetical protein